MNVKELKELLSKFNDSDEIFIECENDEENPIWNLEYFDFRMVKSDIYSDERWVIFRI